MMSESDASEAYRVGFDAVRAMVGGETKKSVVLERKGGVTTTALTNLENIAAKDRGVPTKYINGLMGPTQEFVDEFISTIGGPVAIPHYSTMRYKTVKVPTAVKKSPYIKGK